MLNQKLLAILSHFDKKTFERCLKFLQSPYFNDAYNATYIIQLYEHIRMHNAVANAPELQKKFVFDLIYRGLPAKKTVPKATIKQQATVKQVRIEGYTRLEDLMSDLLKLVRQFLVQENKQQDTGKEFDGLLAEVIFFSRYGVKESFEQSKERARKALLAQNIKGSAWLHRNFLLEESIHINETIFNETKDDTNILTMHKYLDTFYATLKMQLSCKLIILENQIKLDPNKMTKSGIQEAKILTNKLLPMIRKRHLTSPILDFFVKVYDMLTRMFNQKDIEKLEDLLAENKKTIPHENLFEMNTFIRVFWTRLYYKERNEQNLIKVFEKFEEHWKNKDLYFHGKLLQSTLTATVKIGLKLKKNEWVENFLHEHPFEKIWNLDNSQDFKNLTYSILHVHQSDYEKVILPDNKMKNVFYDAIYRILIIKICYDNEESPLLLIEGQINAFKVQVCRRISDVQKPAFNNFLNFLKDLINIKSLPYASSRKIAAAELMAKRKDEPNIVEKEWLLEKVNELL